MSQDSESNQGPGKTYRYGERTIPFQPPVAPDAVNVVSDHVERHLGPVDSVWHEIVSDLVHIDLHHVLPTADRPFHTLVTTGMSDSPMSPPEGYEECRHAELIAVLPPDWPISKEAFDDEANYWPLRWLKTLARFPHEYDTWLWAGHTVLNGDPAQPFAPDTKLCCALLESPLTAPEGFHWLEIDERKTINFFALVPLYREEMEFKLKHGADALLDRFDKHGVSEMIHPARPNVCKRRFGLF